MRPSKLSGFRNIVSVLALSLSGLCFSALAQSHEHVLYPFTGLPPNCGDPSAPLVTDAAGNLYGTTYELGAYMGGCVFELSHSGNGWQETVLHSFSGIDGWQPMGALIFDKLGNLYGTAIGGGAYGGGVAFEMSPSIDGGWTQTVLHNFGGSHDGCGLKSELVFDNAGNLYGTTANSGGQRTGGTVYRLSPGVGGWTETVLYTFPSSSAGPNGNVPAGGVVIDRDGRLYGNTGVGGATGNGAVYMLVPADEGYKESIIHSFNLYDGLQPMSGLTMDRDGNLYGTTGSGGDLSACYLGCGVVFELTKDAAGVWTEKVLHQMTGSDGSSTVGPVVFDSRGDLYAAAGFGGRNGDGSVFKLTPTTSGPWKETLLHLFDYKLPSDQDGRAPYGGVIFDHGKVFGTTLTGGTYDSGTVFEITLQGNSSTTPIPTETNTP